MDEVESVAKSGDSGVYEIFEDSDPRSQDEEAETKPSILRTSLSCTRSSSSGRFSRSRSSHSAHVHSVEDEVIDIESDTCFKEPPAPSLVGISPKPEFKAKKDTCDKFLEYLNILAHLALFGIIGVLIRYGLEVLFDDVLAVTHESTIAYRDLPANMVGSFFMGWVGIVFKERIRSFSEPLAVGLSTGLMGSITTYAGWNQKMVVLLTSGNVVASLAGLLVGMSAAFMSLVAGIHSAEALGAILHLQRKIILPEDNPTKQMPVRFRGGKLMSTVAAAAAACLWGAALSLVISGRSSQSLRILWFACLVGPPGVWMRWHLASFNGRGVYGNLKWLPLGTLLANLIGASLEGILALLQFVRTDDTSVLLLGGLQLGFIGCLTTVSTFVAEVYAMAVAHKLLANAYMYTFLTLILGLLLSIFVYSIPSWALHYVKW